MRPLASWAALGLTLALAAEARPGADVKKEADKLQGTWTAEKGLLDGTDVIEKVGNLQVIFSGDQIIFRGTEKGKPKEKKATFAIDPAQKPRAIDLTPPELKPNEAPARGIYELDGDTLRLCIAGANRPRPTEFSDKGQVLFTLKRKKA
jgi:uncharacterized protein (TIGR03067 family)